MVLNLHTTSLILLFNSVHRSSANIGFDIYGNPGRFKPKHTISVNQKTCEYTGVIEIDVVDANLPFPPTFPDSCTLDEELCENQSCLYQVRNAYKLGKEFESITGFNHVGLDWSPCGLPPLDRFGRPLLNIHFFRVSPEERETQVCDMRDEFICEYPPGEQSTISGRKYFVVNADVGSGKIANVPETHDYELDSAVPSEGLRTWDQAGAADVNDWFNPHLVMGLYDGGVQFWDTMVPYEFISGEKAHMYEETLVYNQQTIVSLPSHWAMVYDPKTHITELTINGVSENCEAILSKSDGGKEPTVRDSTTKQDGKKKENKNKKEKNTEGKSKNKDKNDTNEQPNGQPASNDKQNDEKSGDETASDKKSKENDVNKKHHEKKTKETKDNGEKQKKVKKGKRIGQPKEKKSSMVSGDEGVGADVDEDIDEIFSSDEVSDIGSEQANEVDVEAEVEADVSGGQTYDAEAVAGTDADVGGPGEIQKTRDRHHHDARKESIADRKKQKTENRNDKNSAPVPQLAENNQTLAEHGPRCC